MSNMVSLSLFLFPLITILVFSCCSRCDARDSIHVSELLSESVENLVSAGGRFELGFFTPEGNVEGHRYLGIWYSELLPRTVVWVARRDTPLSDSCGALFIADDGNVRVRCGDGHGFLITSLERSRNLNRTLQLLDNGNLVLDDGESGARLWQSFNEPTDTFLPGMKMNFDLKLTSWSSPSDPREGNYTFRQEEQGVYIIRKGIAVRWKSVEPYMFEKQDGLLPTFINQMSSDSNGTKEQLSQRAIPLPNATSYNNSRLMMNSLGEIQFFNLIINNGVRWDLLLSYPNGRCGVSKPCGSYGICSEKDEPMCRCPLGYKAVSQENWKDGGCERVSTVCNQSRTFSSLLLTNVQGQMASYDDAVGEEDCKNECLKECSCKAYYFKNIRVRKDQTSNRSCNIWMEELVFYGDGSYGELNLSLRVPPHPPPADEGVVNTKKNSTRNSSQIKSVTVIAVTGIVLLSFFGCLLYRRRRMTEQPGYHRNTGPSPVLFSNDSERQEHNLMQESEKLIDVPFYDLESILSATDNFSDANKLGQGGFGPVYKGMFPGGQEIAVKRLSSCSGQGIEEFLNEVVLIAKLQHRNLVRLLGYCIKGSEKLLLYEYMPNRSLDAFIFDQHNSLLLDWKKRFDIIMGIARGLLYLHQDSRLRIIHRDLKTSNILLDEDMNPKISDFGLARIVQGKGTEASTNKVVGTYGYMSPEYALDGKFSIKSDVFSFGVVMLEIVSGRKNTGFYNPKQVLNLLGHAWRLWCDNKALDIIDPTLLESCEESEVIKCINVGLLCVQEDPNVRPPMSTVVLMLGSETNTLPLPTQPAFVVRRRLSSKSSSSSAKPDSISVNELTFSMEEGR